MKQELIWELMKQAGELAYEEHKAKCLKEGLDPMMPFGNNLGKTFEKFAELIVKETLQVARAGIEFGDGMEDAVYTYFGVEND